MMDVHKINRKVQWEIFKNAKYNVIVQLSEKNKKLSSSILKLSH